MALRPHAKTHKCWEIARRQLEAGAGGLTVATVSEAEIFAEAGCTDLFIAYPLWADDRRGARLRALAQRCSLRVGIDSAAGAQALARNAGTAFEVLVEVDSGHHRTGVPAPAAGEVALAAARAGLIVRGVFTFPGHSYGPGLPATAVLDEAQALQDAALAVRNAGVPIDVLSGGSSPTAALTAGSPVTELRPGVYVFNDAQQWELGACGVDEVALTVIGTVVSRAPDRFVLDAGSKVLGADRPPWTTGFGRLPDYPAARISALSEHHATVSWPEEEKRPELGATVRVMPNHVCTAVNLADEIVVLSGGAVVDRWPVIARGANT
jgi:D-serine deaminase-like pyridoxal phosphate-dependent protein